MAMLLIREPTQAKHLFETTNQTQLTIGRSVENGLALHHASVSRRHAALYESNSGKWTIEDLKSRNGTFVNGRRVQRAALRTTDTVRIGDFELVYFGESDTNANGFKGIRQWRTPKLDLADEETRATTMQPGVTRHTATSADRLAAVIRPVDANGMAWRPGKKTTFFGGEGGIAIARLLDLGPAAEVNWNRRAHLIRRVSWYAHLTVNGVRVEEKVELQPDDRIRIGRSEFVYEVTGDPLTSSKLTV
jgi:pSer/pThr/pTyr-binding forkhead associated (FHA) protein